MGTPDPTPRRYRVSRGFGRSPRFVMATSQTAARLLAIHFERATWRLIAKLEHAA